MDINGVLFDILVVLVAAKVAAEIADRIGLPAVVGEIVAGVLIGPSVLRLVEPNDVLATLAELGVILLLLDVGMEMNLADLGKVGRAAIGVATVGVIVPFGAGIGGSLALGLDLQEAVFLGAALTATSVGITARVFGDLRALATVEARTVLGAAVADDVMGLLILTVVTRVVTEGSVSVLGVVQLTVLAVGFLVVATILGLRFAPPLFRMVARRSRSNGTLVAMALAFTLALSEVAHLVQLAPIIGAFVAGLALARTGPSERIRRELAPIGHLFIPVFFLQIGIDADIGEFAKPEALGLAAVLLVIAVVGKLVASAGLFGSPGDRLLVGIGMVPRGEVGLIFATLGLREGVFGDDVYASLLIVVLVTTLATPPALRWRLNKLRAGSDEGDGGSLIGAVEAARRAGTESLSDHDLAKMREVAPGVRKLDAATQQALLGLVVAGNERSWRMLTVTGVLDRALPELAEVFDDAGHESFADPLVAFRWPRVQRLREEGTIDPVLLLAALALDATGNTDHDAVGVALATGERLGLPAADLAALGSLVGDTELLAGGARRPDGLGEEPVQTLAAHLGSAERVDRLARLTIAGGELDEWECERIEALAGLVGEVLAAEETEGTASVLDLERRRADALGLLGSPSEAESLRLVHEAPRAYLLRNDAATVARHATRRAQPVGRSEVRVFVDPVDAADRTRPTDATGAADGSDAGGQEWRVEFVARDRLGLLAREARALSEFRADVLDATVVTWPGGRALSSFRVRSSAAPDGNALAARMRELLILPLAAAPTDELELAFDDHGSPWHTRCTARGPNRLGVLAAVTTAFAVAGASVHSATISGDSDRVNDVFELTNSRGAKLDERVKRRIVSALRDGSVRAARGPRVRATR